MSTLTITISYKGTIKKDIYTYINTIKEKNRDNSEIIKHLDAILATTIINSTREPFSKYSTLTTLRLY